MSLVTTFDPPVAGFRAKAALYTGRVLSGLFVAFMIFDVGIKLSGLPIVDETMAQLGWPSGYGPSLAGLEAVFTALYLFRRTSALGAVLMTGVLGGAVATHLRVGSPLFSHVLFGVYLGALMWGGLYLRDPRVRAVSPL